MKTEKIEAAAGRLDQAERTRVQIGLLSLEHPEMDMTAAYAIQAAWVARKLAAGRTILGHKIGLTSANAGVVLGGRPLRPLETDLRWVAAIVSRNAAVEETGLEAPQRQTRWGAPAPRSWFEEGSLFSGIEPRVAELDAQPIIAP